MQHRDKIVYVFPYSNQRKVPNIECVRDFTCTAILNASVSYPYLMISVFLIIFTCHLQTTKNSWEKLVYLSFGIELSCCFFKATFLTAGSVVEPEPPFLARAEAVKKGAAPALKLKVQL